MKQLLFPLLLFPAFAVAQYPGNANQKITLGEQTTADGLIFRGVAADTTLTVKSDTAAYFVLDTVNLNLYTYKASASGRKWRQLGADTAVIAYVNTYGTQTVNGAKTFTSELTATRFNPTANTATGTGMFLPAANTLGFSTNETEKVTITSGGNVGIGTTSPTSLSGYTTLSINNGTYGSIFEVMYGNTAYGRYFANTNSSVNLTSLTSIPLVFGTNDTERMRITSGGNVGIGVTPSAWRSIERALQIGATTSVTDVANFGVFRNNHYVNSSNQEIYLTTNGASALVLAPNSEYRFLQAASGTAGDVISFTQAMTLDASGRLGIGTASPSAALHLKAGTSSANTAPLKFTSGTNLTTAEAGAMEFNGTNLLFSPSTTRHTVNHGLTGSATIDFADTSANSYSDQTITVTGASDGDVVSLGIPNAAMSANNITYTAWVSASNTVTIRFANHTTGSVNPASGTFKVFVTK